MIPDKPEPPMRRREALLALGGLGAGAALGALAAATAAGAERRLPAAARADRGPYHLDLDLVRRDIRGDRRGTPLSLRFTVVDATDCRPLRGAAVEIWHADASGRYSGVAGEGGNYLRGIQRTGASGVARFETVFPGWYRGRTPHIHMKVFVSGDEVHTGQVFFRPAVTSRVYSQGAYASRGQADTSNAADGIYRQAGARALCSLRRKGRGVSAGYDGSMTIGVDVG